MSVLSDLLFDIRRQQNSGSAPNYLKLFFKHPAPNSFIILNTIILNNLDITTEFNIEKIYRHTKDHERRNSEL